MRFISWGKIFLIITILCLPACSRLGGVNAPPTLKIGLVAPFEGLHRPLGYEALFGVKLALQERNLAEGVGGYRIELVALNDFDDPVEAAKQARALIADPEVLGVIGHLSAATTQAAAPIYQEAGLALVVPWSTTALKAEGGGVVSVAANLAATTTRLETLGQDMGFNSITEVVDTNLSTIKSETQALVVDTEGVTAGEILVALRRDDLSLPVFGQVDTGSRQTVEVAQKAANGLIFVSPGPDPQQMEQAATFNEAFQTLAGFPPGPRAVLAYDATQILLDAVEQGLQNNYAPTRAEVSALLSTVERQGLSGDIVFDQRGERVNAPVWVYQIVDEAYPGVLLSP